MIPAAAALEVDWVDLAAVRFDAQPIDPAQVEFYTDALAGHDGHLAPPILNADMTVRDGRHRLLAHLAAGRTRARVLIVKAPD